MEPALISWILIHRWLAPRKHWYSFTYHGGMESWVGLGGNYGRIKFWIAAKPGIELGTLWSEGRDLTFCANHARLEKHEHVTNLVDGIIVTRSIVTKCVTITFRLAAKSFQRDQQTVYAKKDLRIGIPTLPVSSYT